MSVENPHCDNDLEGPGPDVKFPMPVVGEDVAFLKNVITNPNIIVGDYTYYHDYRGADRFEKENVLYHEDFLGDKLIIGKFTQIAMGTRFMMSASMHQSDGFSSFPFAIFSLKWAEKYPVNFPVPGDTIVGNDVWFGYNCLVMPGIRIGNGSIIASNSVVVKDVEPYSVIGGNPGKVIKKRFSDEVIKELEEIQWWNWPMEKILENLPAITGADIQALKI